MNTQLFRPGLFSLLTNPFHLTRKQLFKNIVEVSPSISGKILDVGCGTLPYKNIFKTIQYTGLEIDTRTKREQGSADIFYDGKKFPFEDNSFDSVVSFQVAEHVQDID